jgi:large subunit ribosomal protein L24
MPESYREQATIHVRRGDTVKISQGKDSGKTGKVVRVFTKNGMIIVEGVNIVKKARPFNVGKALLVCTSCGKTTRLAHKVVNGKKVRYCKKCDAVIADSE